jgi:hypothetical protein
MKSIAAVQKGIPKVGEIAEFGCETLKNAKDMALRTWRNFFDIFFLRVETLLLSRQFR